jgi:iron-sulfur cluster repair protein YtfE (RIC family)
MTSAYRWKGKVFWKGHFNIKNKIMDHITSWRNVNQHLRLRNQEFEYPHYADNGVHSRGITKPDFNSLESMIEHDLKRFHKNSKSDVTIIYELSQEVFYRHNEGNPELAELAASLFMFFSDFTYYLNIEEQQFIPAVQDLLQKSESTKIQNW